MEVRKYKSHYTNVTVFGENGIYYIMLNGEMMSKQIKGTMDEAVLCSMQLVMTIYSQVIKEISDASDRYLESVDQVPVQPNEGTVNETDGGGQGFRILYPEANGVGTPGQCGEVAKKLPSDA